MPLCFASWPCWCQDRADVRVVILRQKPLSAWTIQRFDSSNGVKLEPKEHVMKIFQTLWVHRVIASCHSWSLFEPADFERTTTLFGKVYWKVLLKWLWPEALACRVYNVGRGDHLCWSKSCCLQCGSVAAFCWATSNGGHHCISDSICGGLSEDENEKHKLQTDPHLHLASAH